MAWSLVANGTDLLTAFGFSPTETDGLLDAPDRSWLEQPIRGKAGTMLTTPVREEGRLITLTGALTTSAKTVAARLAAEDRFKDALRAGLLRLVQTDASGSARLIEGFAKQVRLKPIGHPVSPTDDRVTIVMKCPDAYWRDAEPQLKAIAATATRYTLPLGTAPSTPIIRIMNGATPTLTYRDAGGVAQATMVFATVGANDYLDIDMRLQRITKYSSGVASNGRSQLTSGDFPWAFDPQDGDYATSSWPTLEISAGSAEALWWRQWL